MNQRLEKRARRMLAMFCMALCLALSGQITLAMLDRLQHVLAVEHAPSSLAGEVADGHHDHSDVHHTSAEDHHPPGAPDDDSATTGHDALAHQHQGGGVLVPWLASAMFVFSRPLPLAAAYHQGAGPHADAAERRRERPPKPALSDAV